MIYFKYGVIVFLSIVLQISIIEQFVNILLFINLPLLVIIFFNWLSPNNKTIIFSIGMAWGQSYFDALPFGLNILLFTITALFVQRLSLTYLTNKTGWSLIIAGILGVIAHNSMLVLISIGQYGIDFDFTRMYILQISAILTQVAIAILALLLFKLTIFRYEIPKA